MIVYLYCTFINKLFVSLFNFKNILRQKEIVNKKLG